jgi:hypothetical protein
MNRAKVNDDEFWCMVGAFRRQDPVPLRKRDWRQFSYVSEVYPIPLLADCDRCGRHFSHEIGKWRLCCGQEE